MRSFAHPLNAGWGRYAEADEHGNVDTETNDSEASDSDSLSEGAHMHPYRVQAVVPRCKKLHHTVAYIVPAPKSTAKSTAVGPDTVIYNIVYTNSSALPLLVPIKSKLARGW